MDGLLLINTKNRTLILNSRFSSTSTYHPLTITHSLIHLIITHHNLDNIPTILHLPTIDIEPITTTTSQSDEDDDDDDDDDEAQLNSPATHASICCNLIRHQLWLACVTSADMEPSIIFEYLNQFWNLLIKYLNPTTSGNKIISPSMIEANFELVYQLIHLTAPTRENPFGKNWSQLELIDELIPIKTKLLSKLISDATETLNRGKHQYRPKPTIFSSTIPWRPHGLEHAKQEIWLDLIESISATLDPEGHILRFEVVGVVDIQSKLSGLPDISLKFTDPTKIGKVGFHSCVRYNKWEKEKIISFIPPDGRFRLMSYRSTPIHSSSLPVTVRSTISQGDQGGSFKLAVTCLSAISRLTLRWQLGKLATGIIPEQLHCRARDGRNIQPSWEWDEAKKEISWSLQGEDANCCITGLWRHRSKENEPSHAIGVEFESRVGSPNLSFLGLKVDKMEIQQQGSSSAAHPFLNNTHHDHHAHHRDATSNGLASLAASFVTPAAAVSKGVKMKFRSSRNPSGCTYNYEAGAGVW
ncbi:hypothetical protein PCANC_11595 [Puccinia coronata f. sp. avenae]|uniref:MHD domain-containing protein n=1 Tax=Puccinia coronata f. sp. avenae TaxID=200324 RepID=A0A2N5V7U3_9BASI|nr:hypothetical protein PCASD_18300 [Puccinia coronata f. sp. avenae]PLW46070.1 hypothetical protein PCANC_11595 [Puccinia coronata f. sp. avenae]